MLIHYGVTISWVWYARNSIVLTRCSNNLWRNREDVKRQSGRLREVKFAVLEQLYCGRVIETECNVLQ